MREEGGEVGESVISYRNCSIAVVMFQLISQITDVAGIKKS